MDKANDRDYQNNIEETIFAFMDIGYKVTVNIHDQDNEAYFVGFKVGRYGNKSTAEFGGYLAGFNAKITINSIVIRDNIATIDTEEYGVITVTK